MVTYIKVISPLVLSLLGYCLLIMKAAVAILLASALAIDAAPLQGAQLNQRAFLRADGDDGKPKVGRQ